MQELGNISLKMKASETTLYQYCVGALDTSTAGQCVRCSGANAGKLAGVLRNASLAEGEVGNFQYAGIAEVLIGNGTVNIGDVLVVYNAAGAVAAKGTGAHTSGTGIVGRAIKGGVSGDVIECFLLIGSEYSS